MLTFAANPPFSHLEYKTLAVTRIALNIKQNSLKITK